MRTFPDEKIDLITKIQEVTGRTPTGLIEVLNIIVDPAVLNYTRRYISSRDGGLDLECATHYFPWDCFKESEARMENSRNGWIGDDGHSNLDLWCDVCLVRKEREEKHG